MNQSDAARSFLCQTMSAMLRVSGRKLDPQMVARLTTLPVAMLYQKGEPVFPRTQPRGRKHKFSGINIRLTRFDGFRGQTRALVRKALRVIEARRREVTRIAKMPGVESVVLDIGVAKLDVAGQFERIPAAHLLKLGKMGIDLEISIYHLFEDE